MSRAKFSRPDAAEEQALTQLILALFGLPDEGQAWVLARLGAPLLRRLQVHWPAFAHQGQTPPHDAWRVWLIQAGRGFGKTRAGAEWVSARAREDGRLRFALVGATIDEVANVMIRGPSGLMGVARAEEDVLWFPSARRVDFASGAQAFAYSGSNPDKLRGPEHDHAWCDELAKWVHGPETWQNLQMGLRANEDARILITTTPRTTDWLKRIKADPATVTTGGGTKDNPHLPPSFVKAMMEAYGGTRIGRQELDGEMIDEVEGALWPPELIERARMGETARTVELTRVVIGVDPPGSAGGDACGIVAAALAVDGIGYVLGDHSVSGRSPEGWAQAVAAAAALHGADRVVAEKNQGGDMVMSVLKAADCTLPVRLVHASRGKAARAEPVAALFEAGRVRLAGSFPALEAELMGMSCTGPYQGPGGSPDRADALVWALTELMLGRKKRPAVRPV